jgi:hypothetical protein
MPPCSDVLTPYSSPLEPHVLAMHRPLSVSLQTRLA